MIQKTTLAQYLCQDSERIISSGKGTEFLFRVCFSMFPIMIQNDTKNNFGTIFVLRF